MYIYTYVYFIILQYITVQCMLSWNTQNLCQEYCYQSVLSFHKLLVKNTCAECAGFDGIKWRQCLGNRKKRLKLPFNILESHKKMPTTLWYFNIAIENGPFTVDFAIQMGMFQFAMLGYQRVPFTIFPWPNEENPPSAPQTSDLHQQN